jgi:anti-anti-sigma factor
MQNSIDHDEPKKISSIKTGGRAILTPGKSIIREKCQGLKDHIDALKEERKNEIILDCKAVAFLDSVALELLLQTHDELRKQGGALKIAGLNSICRDILVATRLINVLYVYENVHKAVTNRS